MNLLLLYLLSTTVLANGQWVGDMFDVKKEIAKWNKILAMEIDLRKPKSEKEVAEQREALVKLQESKLDNQINSSLNTRYNQSEKKYGMDMQRLNQFPFGFYNQSRKNIQMGSQGSDQVPYRFQKNPWQNIRTGSHGPNRVPYAFNNQPGHNFGTGSQGPGQVPQGFNKQPEKIIGTSSQETNQVPYGLNKQQGHNIRTGSKKVPFEYHNNQEQNFRRGSQGPKQGPSGFNNNQSRYNLKMGQTLSNYSVKSFRMDPKSMNKIPYNYFNQKYNDFGTDLNVMPNGFFNRSDNNIRINSNCMQKQSRLYEKYEPSNSFALHQKDMENVPYGYSDQPLNNLRTGQYGMNNDYIDNPFNKLARGFGNQPSAGVSVAQSCGKNEYVNKHFNKAGTGYQTPFNTFGNGDQASFGFGFGPTHINSGVQNPFNKADNGDQPPFSFGFGPTHINNGVQNPFNKAGNGDQPPFSFGFGPTHINNGVQNPFNKGGNGDQPPFSFGFGPTHINNGVQNPFNKAGNGDQPPFSFGFGPTHINNGVQNPFNKGGNGDQPPFSFGFGPTHINNGVQNPFNKGGNGDQPPFSFGFGPTHINNGVQNPFNNAGNGYQPPSGFGPHNNPSGNVQNGNFQNQFGPVPSQFLQMMKGQQGNHNFEQNGINGQENNPYQNGFSVGVNENYSFRSGPNGSQYQGSLFQRTNDKNYEGLSSLNMKKAYENQFRFFNQANNFNQNPNKKMHHSMGDIKSDDLRKSFNEFMAKSGMNSRCQNAKPMSQDVFEDPNMKHAYEKFMKARFGNINPQNINGEPLLNYHNNQVPATEESLFKYCNDKNYEGITSMFGMTPDTKYKHFYVERDSPDEGQDDLHRKILQQNEYVKANEKNLKEYFKFEKEKRAEYDRDVAYGRIKVKREVQNHGIQSDEPKNENKTHILDDIDKRWNELEKFAGLNKYTGDSDETTEVLKITRKRKPKRSCGIGREDNVHNKDIKHACKIMGNNMFNYNRQYDINVLNDRIFIDKHIYSFKNEAISFFNQDQHGSNKIQVGKKSLSRQIRQSENVDEIVAELTQKCDYFSRLPYHEVFPTLLKEYDKYKEEVYSKAYRKAYRVNGWSSKDFNVPDNPIEKLPQIFRHFKYVSKTRLEEFYFIFMLRLPKLIKVNQRTQNIIDRGFTDPNLRQLKEYWERESEVENDFNNFSKIIRSKIFNTYLEFEDRFNAESPRHFQLSTMPPFNKDPTEEPDLERIKGGGR